jgi:hypothetical protein
VSFAQDPDDLYGDAPISRIEIVCRRNGALSVSGSIDDQRYALAVLDNAKDAIKSFHARKRANGNGSIIVPHCDVAL